MRIAAAQDQIEQSARSKKQQTEADQVLQSECQRLGCRRRRGYEQPRAEGDAARTMTKESNPHFSQPWYGDGGDARRDIATPSVAAAILHFPARNPGQAALTKLP